MSEEQVMRAWEECVVARGGKGCRTIHYVIRDTTGFHLLAVVGIESSRKHIVYTVANDFIRLFGSTSEVHAGKRWKRRCDVVEWLMSIVSKRAPILADSSNLHEVQLIIAKMASLE